MKCCADVDVVWIDGRLRSETDETVASDVSPVAPVSGDEGSNRPQSAG